MKERISSFEEFEQLAAELRRDPKLLRRMQIKKMFKVLAKERALKNWKELFRVNIKDLEESLNFYFGEVVGKNVALKINYTENGLDFMESYWACHFIVLLPKVENPQYRSDYESVFMVNHPTTYLEAEGNQNTSGTYLAVPLYTSLENCAQNKKYSSLVKLAMMDALRKTLQKQQVNKYNFYTQKREELNNILKACADAEFRKDYICTLNEEIENLLLQKQTLADELMALKERLAELNKKLFTPEVADEIMKKNRLSQDLECKIAELDIKVNNLYSIINDLSSEESIKVLQGSTAFDLNRLENHNLSVVEDFNRI